MAITQTDLDWYGRMLCMPLSLIINFSLFQYLAVMYRQRLRQRYVKLLLFCGLASFVVMIPLAHPDDFVVDRLTKISEILSVLTFLVQIAMIGRSINQKMRIRSLALMTLAAEGLTWVGIALSIKDVAELATHDGLGKLDASDDVMEDVALLFLCVFRLYFASLSRGLREALATRKTEIFLYVLYVTHEYPFLALSYATGLDWDEIQALWNRVTLAMCLLHTIREKARSSARRGHMTGSMSRMSSTVRSERGQSFRQLPQLALIRNASRSSLTLKQRVAVAPFGSFATRT